VAPPISDFVQFGNPAFEFGMANGAIWPSLRSKRVTYCHIMDQSIAALLKMWGLDA
jgi:hypothetical protein